MSSSVLRPLSSLSEQIVTEYLVAKGHNPAVIKWKYFDSQFTRNHERGYVFLHEGKVAGFIGLIPFAAARPTGPVTAAWSCDWYREPHAPGAVGLMLVKESLASYSAIYSFGGSRNTRSIFSRLATLTVEDAGVVFHKPLRLGGLLKPVAHKLRWPFLGAWQALNKLPMKRVSGAPADSLAKIDNTINLGIVPILEENSSAGGFALYNFEYVNWQIGRCPAIVSHMCTVPGDASPRTVAFFWHPIETTDFWRLAILSGGNNADQIRTALVKASHFIYQQGGLMMSIVVSRLDNKLITVLRQAGFVPSKQRRPLYILTSEMRSNSLEEPSGLSYLDTDWAYRFSL